MLIEANRVWHSIFAKHDCDVLHRTCFSHFLPLSTFNGFRYVYEQGGSSCQLTANTEMNGGKAHISVSECENVCATESRLDRLAHFAANYTNRGRNRRSFDAYG